MSYFDDDLKKPTKYQDQLENYLPIPKKDLNKYLCKTYPFLIPRNRWSGMRITGAQNGGYWPGDPEAIPEYDYEYTELDSMPEGWRIAFGIEMCEEIKQELLRFSTYHIDP